MICVAFLWHHRIALKYTSLDHYLNNTCIHTKTSTGICLSTTRQNKTCITHTTKRPVSTLVSFLNKIRGKPCSLWADRHVLIWPFSKHGDLWLVLQVQPTLWGLADLGFKEREEMPCPSCHSHSEANDVAEMWWRDLNRKIKENRIS